MRATTDSSSSTRKPLPTKGKRIAASPSGEKPRSQKTAGSHQGSASKTNKSAARRKSASADQAAETQPEPGNGAWWAF
jgi:hypothetical protein